MKEFNAETVRIEAASALKTVMEAQAGQSRRSRKTGAIELLLDSAIQGSEQINVPALVLQR